MAQQRFRVPSQNGEVLAVPEFQALPRLIAENRRRLDRSVVEISGIPLQEFRTLARQELLAESEGLPGQSSGPLILSGHQPELSHPGVWIKNFLLCGLARKTGGIGLNLIVDNDTLKSASLHFPAFTEGNASSVRLESLAYDLFSGEMPFEERPILDPELFRSFPARSKALWQNWGYEPLLASAWREAKTIRDAFVASRLDCERAWGCHNRELLVSRLSQSNAFQRFARHILADLPRFAGVYNEAIRSYRRANGIRSRSHPAPELADGEAPFWELTGPEGKRQRATAASNPAALRPRALTLTLFARVCLGDFFIHGIGGGKYDEVTDQITLHYFGLEPPAYQVLSATLHLPLPTFPATGESLQRAERRVRDLHWNPQFHLEKNRSEANALAASKEQMIRSEPPRSDRQIRRAWFRSLQQATRDLRPFVAAQVPEAEMSVQRIREELAANRILARRDYSWPLYPESLLRPFLQQFLELTSC